MRKAFGLMLASALALSWVAPLCAQPAAPSHACCSGGQSPAPDHGRLPPCCRVTEGVPAADAAAVSAPAPVLLSSVAAAVETPVVLWAGPPRSVPAAPQAPPGTHSGLSPPSSGL